MPKALRQIVKEDVDHGGGVQREGLAQQQSADHGDAQRSAQLGTETSPKRERQSPQQCGHRRHHDGAEAQQTRFVNRVSRVFSVLPLAFEREVDHHDAVLFYDTDQQDNADDRYHAQVLVKENQREESAYARRRKRREDRNRVDKALV